MSATSTSLSAIDKLRGSLNYVDWRFEMENVLRLEDLWSCIVGYPDGDTTTSAKKAKDESRARARLNLMVDKSIFPIVMPCKTCLLYTSPSPRD